MHDVSLVLATYGRAGRAMGVVGVLGPTRMAYPHAISTVRYVSGLMNELVDHLYACTHERIAIENRPDGASDTRRRAHRRARHVPGRSARRSTNCATRRLEREQEAAENKAGWQRSAADFANYRRRTEQQRDEELGLANEVLLLKLLGVADDFDRAIAHVPPDQRDSAWVEGIAAIDRKLDRCSSRRA